MTKKIIYYRSLGSELRERFGGKLYKIALDGGFTCPNRDGTLGVRGCSFCLAGSGGFSDATGQLLPEDPETVYQNAVQSAIEKGITRVRKKADGSGYIAYFQRYTSTYAPLEKLRKLYSAALSRPEIRALSSIMAAYGAKDPLMTGSGAAVFSLFESREKAEVVASLLRQDGFFAAVAPLL